jgi:hypothetical protein
MATFQVIAVETEQASYSTHEHISRVQVRSEGSGGTGFCLSRSTVVADIRKSGGDRYYTEVSGRRANVEVVSCPRCTFTDYLRTDADSSTSNNLLSLPKAVC